jgi:hypothetical protein
VNSSRFTHTTCIQIYLYTYIYGEIKKKRMGENITEKKKLRCIFHSSALILSRHEEQTSGFVESWVHKGIQVKYNAPSFILRSNCRFPTTGRSRMTHRQAQLSAAAKIIHTTVQLCL